MYQWRGGLGIEVVSADIYPVLPWSIHVGHMRRESSGHLKGQ